MLIQSLRPALIILRAGRSWRWGGPSPKQWHDLGGWQGPASVHTAQELEHRTGKGQQELNGVAPLPLSFRTKTWALIAASLRSTPHPYMGGVGAQWEGREQQKRGKPCAFLLLNVLQVPMLNRHLSRPAVSGPDMPFRVCCPWENRPTAPCRHRQWEGHSMTPLCRGSCLCRQVAGPCQRLSAGAAKGILLGLR